VRTKRPGCGLGGRQIQQDGTAGCLGDEPADAIDRERAGGAEESVVADFLKAAGEQMIQETADELDGLQAHATRLTRRFVTDSEGHHAVLTAEDAAVGDGNTEDVTGQILQGTSSITDGLAVHDPGLLPDFGGDEIEQAGLVDGMAELGAEDH